METSYKVILTRDPINLILYVMLVLKRIIGLNSELAKNLALEVQEKGSSVIYKGRREESEHYVYTLQKWQLNAHLEKDEQND